MDLDLHVYHHEALARATNLATWLAYIAFAVLTRMEIKVRPHSPYPAWLLSVLGQFVFWCGLHHLHMTFPRFFVLGGGDARPLIDVIMAGVSWIAVIGYGFWLREEAIKMDDVRQGVSAGEG